MKSANAPKKSPKQERSKSVVQSIVEAALRALGRGEYERVTTTKIAELAGVSVGSLYQYFPNKEAIVGQLVDRVVEKNLARIFESLASLGPHSPEEAIDAMVDVVADLFLDESRLLRVLFEKASGLNGVAAEMRARRAVMQRVQELLTQRGVALPTSDAKLGAFVIVNAVVGVIHGAAVEFPDPATRADLKREVGRLVKNYLSIQ